MNRLLFSRYLLVILTLLRASLSWSQLAIAPANPVPTESEPPAHVTVKLPVRLYWGYLVFVEASVGNIRNLNFLVDTGAYPSVIDQKIAEHLGLTGQPARVNVSNQTVETRLVVLPSLLVGPIHAQSLPVLTEDLSFLQEAVGRKVDGVVGLDVLRKSSFSINYRSKEMLFGAVEDMTFSAPFETDTPVVTVGMEFQNRKLRLVVDSGSPHLMLFQSRMPASIGLQEIGRETVSDAGGTFQCKKVQIAEVHLGKETIGAQIAFVANDRKDDGDNFDGVLGMRGPHFWKVAFDFKQRRFSWER
jgi:predicted aspartyl protease